MGASKTTTTTQQQPPQMMPESREGYIKGQEYYKGILDAPPIYEGNRVAGFTPAQEEAQRQAYASFGQEQPYAQAAKAQVGATAGGQYDYLNPNFMGNQPSEFQDKIYKGVNPAYDYGGYKGVDSQYGYQAYGGVNPKYDYQAIGGGGGAEGGGSFGGFQDLPSKYDYSPETTQYGAYDADVTAGRSAYDYRQGPQFNKMTDAEMQRQIENASEPILAGLTEKVLPQIRESGTLAGQGGTSTRGDVARQQAVEGYGRTVGSSVIAPLMMQQSQLEQDYAKAIQNLEEARTSGDAERITRASQTAESLQAQSHDVTNQINQQRAEADAANKGRYASDWMGQQNVGAQVGAQYADIGSRASIASMQDKTSRAIADAQSRLGYAGMDVQAREEAEKRRLGYATLDTGARSEDARTRLGYAGLDTQAQLDYDRLTQGTRLGYDTLNQQSRLGYDTLMQGAYGDERNRQLQAAGMAPGMDQMEAQRIGQLGMYGGQEQLQGQRELDAQRQAWEEPIFRQGSAANTLMGAAGVGPGGSSTTAEQGGGALGTIMQVAQMAMMAYAMSSKTVKSDIVEIPDEDEIVDDVLNLNIKRWRYTWDPPEIKRMGPILEDSPDWLKDSTKTINILSLVSALVLAIQSQNKRIEALEEKCLDK